MMRKEGQDRATRTHNEVEDSEDDPGNAHDTGSNSSDNGTGGNVRAGVGRVPAVIRGRRVRGDRSERGVGERGCRERCLRSCANRGLD